jgi:hypothetical protein
LRKKTQFAFRNVVHFYLENDYCVVSIEYWNDIMVL